MCNEDKRIAAVGTANPECTVSQDLADSLMTEHYESKLRTRTMDILHQMLRHPSIEKRHVAVSEPSELVTLKGEDPDDRIQRFTKWAVDLSTEAAASAIKKAGIRATEIDAIIVNTCTGYICPGLSTYIMESLNLRKNISAFDLVGAGCGGALPNLDMARGIISQTPGSIVLSIAVEICTATFQMGDDISLVVSNAIFGDGAAAAIIWDRPKGLKILDVKRMYAPEFRDDVRYTYKNGQLHNKLTPQLPKIVREVVPPVVKDLLKNNGLKVKDIQHWAIHPGGDKMIQEIVDRLNLTEEQISVTRSVLAQYGNMSSPTVLFELEKIMTKQMEPGEYCCMVGFGAGMSIHALLAQA